MMPEHKKAIISLWEAKIGSISSGAKAGWFESLGTMAMTDGTIAKQAIERIANQYESNERQGAKPTLTTFENAVGRIKREKGYQIANKAKACNQCDEGVVYVIQVMEFGKMVCIPRYAQNFAGNDVSVGAVPCLCHAGLEIQNKTFKLPHATIRELNEFAYPKILIDGGYINSRQHAWRYALDYVQKALKGGNDRSALGMRNCAEVGDQ